jgi:hypothetical protein
MGNLKIRSVGNVKTASDGRQYFQVGFSAGIGQKEVTRLIWEEFKRDSGTGLPIDEKVWKRGNHKDFMDAMKAGELVQGEIVSRKVESYEIRETKVDSYTAIVFADEKVEAVFAAANHPILDEETGELIGKKQPKTAVLATRMTEKEAEDVIDFAK